MHTTADREEVTEAIWLTLSRFDLQDFTDGVMDSLDTVVEWADDDDE